MSKASIKRHADFHAQATAILTGAGGVIAVDNEHKLEIHLGTKRIGLLVFTMFKRDMDYKPKDELFSLYAKLPTTEQVKQFAPQVNAVFTDRGRETMNPFSGKWNIHGSTVEGILSELRDHRLQWLMSP